MLLSWYNLSNGCKNKFGCIPYTVECASINVLQLFCWPGHDPLSSSTHTQWSSTPPGSRQFVYKLWLLGNHSYLSSDYVHMCVDVYQTNFCILLCIYWGCLLLLVMAGAPYIVPSLSESLAWTNTPVPHIHTCFLYILMILAHAVNVSGQLCVTGNFTCTCTLLCSIELSFLV